jgi:hypothetical protein
VGSVRPTQTVHQRMTYVKYVMYFEYITLSPSASSVSTKDWANHALIGEIERPTGLGPMKVRVA